ncbi:phage tail tube protein [Tranquillimonas alkanivorans]|uniref:Phage tail tube protein, TTP n=1 Tax=Tranquillimonas alkanivorans TaxID=441119 RepID=A0A1I5RW07_9RHOB|nr:phage tail tube protein [Tranquillimonas alkanivorans]SFP62769.1 Phage tail tube protein, TTP [Tranquillimonas alkanivorans]
MIFATNGAKLYISDSAQNTEPADATTYGALTWTEIKEVESLGSFGDTAEEITFTSISDARTRKVKGARNAGTLEVVMGQDYSDAGQAALIAAEKEIHDYAFKVVFNDAPDGGTPSERYFIAKVGSASEALDTANSVMKLNVSLLVDSKITRVDAAAGV